MNKAELEEWLISNKWWDDSFYYFFTDKQIQIQNNEFNDLGFYALFLRDRRTDQDSASLYRIEESSENLVVSIRDMKGKINVGDSYFDLLDESGERILTLTMYEIW